MGIVVFALEVLNALILFGNWENEPYKQKGTQSKKTKQVYYAKKKRKKKKKRFQKWSNHVVLYQKHNVTL